MAMTRETFEQMKEKGREAQQQKKEHLPVEQLNELQNVKGTVERILKCEEEQLAIQNSINKWVKFLGIVVIIGLSLGVLSAIIALATLL